MQINSAYRGFIFNEKRFEILWGSAGSAKSYTAVQKKVLKCISTPYFRCIAVRKIKETLRDSLYALIKKVVIKEGLFDQFQFTTSPLLIRHKPTGNEFLFRGMKDDIDREKIKSIVDPTDVLMEEATEFDEDDLTQLNIRVRGDNDAIKQITLMLNGIDKEHWIKKKVIDQNIYGDNLFLLNTTYKDNKFLADVDRQALEDLIRESDYYYDVYVLGKWGTIDVKGRIYKSFVNSPYPNGNICEWVYKPELPIILCCDFNIDPCKWALIQNVNGIDYVFDEIITVDKGTEYTVKQLREKYPNAWFKVYGDASGTYRQPSAIRTDYMIIKEYIPNAQMMNNTYNPPVPDRLNAVNWRLCNREGVRRLLIDPKCRHVIHDFENTKYAEGKREEDKRDEKYRGDPINSLVHISSAIGYYIEKQYSLKGKPYVHQS